MANIHDNMSDEGCSISGWIASAEKLEPVDTAGFKVPEEWVITREQFMAQAPVDEEDVEGASVFYRFEADVRWDGGGFDMNAFAAGNWLVGLCRDEDEDIVYASLDNYVD
jgi:hypothetical protein